MSAISPLRKIWRLFRHAPRCWQASHSGGRADFDDAHLLAAARWLLQSQYAWGQQGYAHSFHLLHGWQPPYPETTGYLIPSLHRLALRYGIPELHESVQQAANWLLRIQSADGSFPDLNGQAQVFDAGQILIGFNYLLAQAPDVVDHAALTAATRAVGSWLVSVQEPDGSFVRSAYQQRPHAYYSRVGAAMLVAGRLLDDAALRQAGQAQLDWVLAQQLPNGFFQHASFDDQPPFSHTMIYIVEGLLDAHDETGAARYLDAVLAFCRPLRQAVAGRDLLLRSQYHPDYRVANAELCLTGLAQWAGVCYRLGRLTGEAEWAALADRALEALKRQQLLASADPRLFGGLLGSDRLFGNYMMLALPNWGLKFFIDALLERAKDSPCAA